MATQDSPLSGPTKTIGIIGRPDSSNATDAVRAAVEWLASKPVVTMVESATALRAGLPDTNSSSREELASASDLILVLGGDGTLLSVAHTVATNSPLTPILGVNCGSLGFLTEITLPEMCDALESVLSGTAGVDERRMLRARVMRQSKQIEDRVVLNDVVIGKATGSNIIDFRISVRGRLVTESLADGIIIATPTGSTAYNLAAGGPIVHPTVDAVILTQIAPHTLTNRPIVLGDNAPITVEPKLDTSDAKASVSFDGQVGLQLRRDDRVTVERTPHPLRVVRASSRHYFQVLREKLKWGER
jgi:NAD+ kinase